MSIVALKRKTNTQYNNLSVNRNGFSLNGTHRSQGYVGQTSLSRSLPRTLMRGSTVRGHGGCCGRYPVYHINSEGTGLGSNTLNDPNVVKSSVLDTNGMIMTKYRWIRRPAPETSVKPDTTDKGTYSQYLEDLKRQNLDSQCSITNSAIVINKQCCPFMKRHYTHLDSIARGDSLTKQPISTFPTYDEWNAARTKKCIHDTVLKSQNLGTPFACNNIY